MKNIIFALFIIFIAACSSSKTPNAAGDVKSIGPSQADIDRVASKYPNYTLVDLNKGKSLYDGNCGSCHKLYNPTDFNEAKWTGVVPPMVKKVNKVEVKLSSEDQELILKYLITMSGSSK